MKKTLKKILNTFSYDLIEYPYSKDQHLYKELFPMDSLNNRKFYNIGAGDFSHRYWTNIDFDSEWYSMNRKKTFSGIVYDLLSLTPIPIEDSTAEIVYSSHTVEHITDQAAQNMFNEAYRILKPEGHLRITTPNIDLYVRAYIQNDKHFFYWSKNYSKRKKMLRIKLTEQMNNATCGQIFLFEFASSLSKLCAVGVDNKIDDEELSILFQKMKYEEFLNYLISLCPIEIQKKYPGLHINWWNYNKMYKMLQKSGFSKIINSGYGQSFSPILRNTALFDNTHPRISLYVEAIK